MKRRSRRTNTEIKYELGKVSINYDEVKAELQKTLEEFQSLIFDDESIPVAKKIIADLRKQKKELDSQRISVKKDWLAPFEAAEVKMKELIALFDTPINFIAEQTEGYEERKKAAKRQQITDYFNQEVKDLSEYVSFEKIYNVKWENATYKDSDITKEISEYLDQVQKDIDTIKSMSSDSTTDALAGYKKDNSLANAITYINLYEKQKRDILEKKEREDAERLERERQAEIEKVRMEERQKLLDEQEAERKRLAELEAVREQAKEEIMEELFSAKETTGDIAKVEYTIFGTEEDFAQLEMYMDSIGLTHVRG